MADGVRSDDDHFRGSQNRYEQEIYREEPRKMIILPTYNNFNLIFDIFYVVFKCDNKTLQQAEKKNIKDTIPISKRFVCVQ